METNRYHEPVLKQEVNTLLGVETGQVYIDATLGGGGHTKEILAKGGKVLGIDQDNDSVQFVSNEFKLDIERGNLIVSLGNFRNIKTIAHLHDYSRVDGILFDLGVSSHQLDAGEKGLSFQRNADLDMRLDEELGVKASDLINGLGLKELTLLFTKYGEEPFAYKIAKKIVEVRKTRSLVTTYDLSDLILHTVRTKGHMHPATRVFQALRIAVNDELVNLERALPDALSLLKPKGRLVVISFHSLEDRIVKQTFAKFKERKLGEIITKKPLQATEKEVLTNIRSRSAKLRAFEKL